jgi:hypothetical protein
LIEGLNTRVENYGSSKLGKVVGQVDVTFKDYWTGNSTDKYKTMNGIDRATNVVFDNSYVLLANRGENNELEGIKDITNLWCEEGSGLKVSAPGELKGDFHGGGNFYLDSEVCLTIDGDIYGSTFLVLNPLLTEGVNMIKGTAENPYILIKGTDHSENSTALYGSDARYTIISGINPDGHKIYYIDADVIIDDLTENTVINKAGAVYIEDESEWSTDDIYVRNSRVFSSNVYEHFRFIVDTGTETDFNGLARSVSLVTNDVTVAWPVGTVITIYENGTLYTYRVVQSTQLVPWSSIKDEDDEPYPEIANIQPYSIKIGENLLKHTEAYEYEREYRFIVDFTGVAEEDLLPQGPYNFMVNYTNHGITLAEMRNIAKNIVKIEEPRQYSIPTVFDKIYYEGDGVIVATATIQAEQDFVTEDYYGDPIWAVVSLLDSNGNIVELSDELIIEVNNEQIVHTSANAKFKVLDAVTPESFSHSNTITLDITYDFEHNKLPVGIYYLKLAYYTADEDGNLKTKLCEGMSSFEIKQFIIYHIKAVVTGTGSDSPLILTASDPSRRVNVKYEGTLLDPYIDVEVERSTGDNTYVSASNTFTVNKIEQLTGNNATVVTRGSATPGLYRITYILRNDSGKEKARETLLLKVQ